MKVLGIDFGTSYSSIATIENGKPVPIKTSTAMGTSGDSYSMPTAIYLEESGNILVGQAAELKRGLDPGRFKSEFKRELGQTTPFILGDRQFFPEELCAEIFRYFKETAAISMNGPAEKVVITHPAIFGNLKQDILKQAALRAGFSEVELLDEPTAAAIYYASKQELKEGEKLLVYDLGGGTFDVALIKKQGDGFVPLTAPLGIERCGGIDFDQMIFENIEAQFEEQVQEFLKNEKAPETAKIRFLGDLEVVSLKIKHLLSSSETAEERIAIPGSFEDYQYVLERKAFQGMITNFVKSTCNQIRQIVSNAGLKMSEIDRVLLVGGSTRIPYIEEAIKEVIGKPVYRDADPELAVCFGAAVKGDVKTQRTQPKSVVPPQPLIVDRFDPVAKSIKSKETEGKEAYHEPTKYVEGTNYNSQLVNKSDSKKKNGVRISFLITHIIAATFFVAGIIIKDGIGLWGYGFLIICIYYILKKK